MTLGRIFRRPTSVVVYGTSRPLLNWVAYALATATDLEFIWTDIREPGEGVDDVDPLARSLVPPERLNLVRPSTLVPDDAGANMAIGGVIRGDESPDNVGQLMDFLRLPLPTQEFLSKARSKDSPLVLVLSNAHRHRMAAQPAEMVSSALRVVVGTGVILFVTFVGAPPEGRGAFETVLHVEGNDPREWRRAILRAERGPPDGPFRSGSEYRLGELDWIAAVLARNLN